MQTFRVRAIPAEDTCTLELSGEADLATAQDIVELGILSLEQESIHRLIIDLAEVTFIDSTTIGGLVRLHNLAIERSKQMSLVHVSPRIIRVLQITGLEGTFTISS